MTGQVFPLGGPETAQPVMLRGLKDRREKALWAIQLLAYTLRAQGLYSTRLRELAYSAVMSTGHTRPERVAFVFLGTLERALGGEVVDA